VSGSWSLEQKTESSSVYTLEGTVTDLSVTTSSYFVIAVSQSTASFFQKHFFDSIYLGPIIYDVTPPILLSATPISATVIDVLFDEALDTLSAQNALNFQLSSGPAILNTEVDSANGSLVHLILSAPMVNGQEYMLFAEQIADLSSNPSLQQSIIFQWLFSENAERGDILINEFLCDESPSAGLPEAEYVELFNASQKIFHMQGWKIGDASGFGTIQNGWMYPGEYKVLCASANEAYFTNAAMVTSFPSLNNAGDNIVLQDINGIQIDSLSYTSEWYQDPLKSTGGYAIERINPFDPCSAQDNWKASESVLGGTPTAQNSVFNDSPDSQAPSLVELVPLAPNVLQIFFSEGMDSTHISNAFIETTPMLNIYKRAIYGEHPSMMTLIFSDNLIGGQVYNIELNQFADCWINETDIHATFVLPQTPEKGDLIINEVLFDPLTGGSDWIEVFNRSDKWLDLMDWKLANVDNGVIENFQAITDHFYLAPNAYAVIGSDSSFVKQHYPFTVPGSFVSCETPTYAVDSGTVLLYYFDQLMDTVSYSSDWHFPLLESTDGVSLERVSSDGPSNVKSNWHSAAEAFGFASPGIKNTQDIQGELGGDFSLNPSIISPDNDGFQDVMAFNYTLLEPGMLGTLIVYDDEGREVKKILNNELLGMSGSATWDGITKDQHKANLGNYIAVFEAFSLNGQSAVHKRKAFVVAGRL
jgi:hypothetical protein